MATAPTPALEVSVEIDAPPEVVWRLVSDVRRTGEWSPECRKVIVWGRGRLRKGTKLTGFNRRKYAVWATTSRIHLYHEGRAIGWTVLEHRSQWSYHVAADGGGTRLTERRDNPDGVSVVVPLFANTFLGGVSGHDAELLDGMRTTLERIKALAEA